MNEVLKTEQAYYAALGIPTHYVAEEGNEWLASDATNDSVASIVRRSGAIADIMLWQDIRVEFWHGEVWATHYNSPKYFKVQYGGEQRHSKQQAFGMAVVQAATDRLMRDEI